MTSELSKKAITELQRVIQSDYGVSITEDQANELGLSLLRLTRISVTALARVDEASKKENKNHEIQTEYLHRSSE